MVKVIDMFHFRYLSELRPLSKNRRKFYVRVLVMVGVIGGVFVRSLLGQQSSREAHERPS